MRSRIDAKLGSAAKRPPPLERVLILLLGSLGDTVVALPALHLIARRFPSAERRVLTHFSFHAKAAPMAALLEGSGLVHGYFQFAPHSRSAMGLASLIREIRRWAPDVLVHLHEPRGRMNAVRDRVFFRACGIRRMIGLPLTADLQVPRHLPLLGRYEHRAEYLARSLATLGDSRLTDLASWNLGLSAAEHEAASAALAPVRGCRGIIGISIGTKVDANDWGDENWTKVLQSLSFRLKNWGLVALGAAVERERSESLLSAWTGTRLNLCGALPVRLSAAVLRSCTVFAGHDSGPLHLAASVGTRCVGIFGARNLPGIWFPYGADHTVFYNQVSCYGCALDTCVEMKKRCIMSIPVSEVVEAVAVAAAAGASRSLLQAPRAV